MSARPSGTDRQRICRREEHDDCEKCGKPVYGWVEERCCSGRDCGCMGLPTTPCWCTECWEKWEAQSKRNARAFMGFNNG